MELRPVVARLDDQERPIAGALLLDLAQQASSSDRERLRRTLEETGAVELAEEGTRRRSPWRRAFACEVLGKIGAERSVPVLLERLGDRRPEVHVAAVRALGDIGSPEAAPALTSAFLERRCAPTNVVNDALRRIGPEGAAAFERGARSDLPIVRISSCFGLAATISTGGDVARRSLSDLLSCGPGGSRPDGRSRCIWDRGWGRGPGCASRRHTGCGRSGAPLGGEGARLVR